MQWDCNSFWYKVNQKTERYGCKNEGKNRGQKKIETENKQKDSNAVFQIMSQNTSTRQALAGIEMGMKAQQSYANGMSKMREQVIQGIKETTDLDDQMTVSQYFEAAIDEDGTVKSFEDFQTSYDQILRSQNITGDEYADKMVDAARAYYGTKGRSQAFWDQIGMYYKLLFTEIPIETPFRYNKALIGGLFSDKSWSEYFSDVNEEYIKPPSNVITTAKTVIEKLGLTGETNIKKIVNTLYSYFSSYVAGDIPSKDEADGMDEMFVMYNGFENQPFSFIWDDLLNYYLYRLKSNNLCLIVDSCYSGGFNDESVDIIP